MSPNPFTTIQRYLLPSGRLWLFLDYDGTLVPIARTPEEARPDAELLALLTGLAQSPRIRLTILSGRPLASLQAMLSVPGLMLAGTYGLEIRYPNGFALLRTEPAELRPALERLLPAWSALIGARAGFHLEDKGIALALHARHADPSDAQTVMLSAEVVARQILNPTQFRLLGGDRFFEAAPLLANKGKSVAWLLDEEPSFNGLLVYLGDDDKDEEAFAVVRRRGGIPIVVGGRNSATEAVARLPSPDSARGWLHLLLEAAMPGHRLPPSCGLSVHSPKY